MTEEEFYSLKPGDKITYPSMNIEGIVLKETGISKTFNIDGFPSEWGDRWVVIQITNGGTQGWNCQEGNNYYALCDFGCINLISRAAKKNQRIPIKYIP